jgi:O-antigen/teichoic acid export membrane protein
MSPILAYLEGLGKVTEIAKIRMIQQSVQLIFLLVFLNGGLKLLASPLAAIIACTIAPLWILFSYKRILLINVWNSLSQWKVNYKDEIFPFQWRISLSWISGYFIFQLFNPVIFATDGPVTAGQMGMTLTALNGVMSISMSWINTKVPLFATLIAKKDFITLDKIFDRTLRESSLICGLMLVILIIIVYLLEYYGIALRDRFLPTISIISLCFVTFLNQFIFAYAAYLRSHKKEPFLIQSLVGAVLTSTSTILMGYFYGVNGITIGYLFLTFFTGFFWARNIFNKKKVEWHS